MYKTTFCFYLPLMSFILALSCSSSKNNMASAEALQEKAGIMTTEKPNWQTSPSDVLFDHNTLHTYELNLPIDSLKKLDDAPADEVYVEGSLTFNGEVIAPVGIRYKGSIGSFAFCLSGQDIRNPSGHKTCTKISMKVKIDWKNDEQTFYGQKKLQFHSMNHDKSQMRDRLGYSIFREMGVPAPRSVHARLVINGQYQGLYAFIEQIDEQFTQQNYKEGHGNLYKEVWPLNSGGAPHSDEVYIEGLKTNTQVNDVSITKSFAEAMAAAQTDEEIKSVVANMMDIQSALDYVATDRAIDNDDGAFHWYCRGPFCGPHNFYWYERPISKQAMVIPWDLDHSLFSQNPVTPVADEFGETRADCNPFEYGPMKLTQRSATCDKLIYGWSLYQDEYHIALRKLLEGPYSEDAINRKLDAWSAQIAAATQEAANNHDDAVSIEEWQKDINYLKTKTNEMRISIQEKVKAYKTSK